MSILFALQKSLLNDSIEHSQKANSASVWATCNQEEGAGSCSPGGRKPKEMQVGTSKASGSGTRLELHVLDKAVSHLEVLE